jgi:hypothetical protein
MLLKPETAGITVFPPQEGSSIAFTYRLQMFHYKKKKVSGGREIVEHDYFSARYTNF